MNLISLVITQLNFLISLPVAAPVVVAKPAIIVATNKTIVIDFPVIQLNNIDKQLQEKKVFESQQ